MSDLWGFQAGQQQFQQDSQQKQLFQLQMTEGQQKVQEGAIKLEEEGMTLAAAKAAKKTQEKMLEFMHNKQVQRAAQQGTAAAMPDTDVLPTALSDEVEFYTASGDLEKATQVSKDVAGLRKDQAEIEKGQRDEQKEEYSWISDNMDSVTDDKTLAAFKMRYQAEHNRPLPKQITSMSYKDMQDNGFISEFKNGVKKKLSDLDLAEKAQKVKLEEQQTKEAKLNQSLTIAKTKATEARTASIGKIGGEIAESKDIAAVTNSIQGAYGYKPAEAKALALPIAERVGKLRQQGLSQSEAVATAVKEAKKDGSLKEAKPVAAKNQQQVDDAVQTIDDALKFVEDSEGHPRKYDVTGVAGGYHRARELVSNKLGSSDKTTAAGFESKIDAIRLMVPKILTGSNQGAKYKQDLVDKLTRGLSFGSTQQNTARSLRDLRKILVQQGPPTDDSAEPPAGEPVPFDEYMKRLEAASEEDK
jgi:hypothetical protein